ncbi:unnamed protein product [Ascophyllum nodosum]
MGAAHSAEGLTCLENPPKKNTASEPYSIVIPNTATAERGAIRRCGLPQSVSQGIVLAFNGAHTVYENFRRGVRVNPDGPCLGRREVDSAGNATPYVFETYREIEERIDHFASGLEEERLTLPNPDGMKLLALYSRNRPEWVIAEQAAFVHSAMTVPLYDTLGHDTVEFVLKETGLTTVVCGSAAELQMVASVAEGGNCPMLQNVVVMDGVSERDRAEAVRMGLRRVYTFIELEGIGASHVHPHRPPAATDMATFCYTSGTTGNPKGALLTHQNFIAGAAAAFLMETVKPCADDFYLSFLPLPHIFERMVHVTHLNNGAAIGFYRGDPTLLLEDLRALRPTTLAMVPRVMNRLHDNIVYGVMGMGGMKARLFVKACEAKVRGLHRGRLKHALWDTLVFGKIKEAIGLDRVRVMLTGAAPVATHVITFMRIVVGSPLLEGYGQTETTAGATMTQKDDFSAGHVGGPFSCNEICLKDIPEMGYRHTDTWHGGDPRDSEGGGIPCDGRGEVCFRGGNIFVGYYKQEDKTREAFDEDGWLQSGDIGLWTADGALKIIDRKKNIFKLAQGEYIAPEKLENIHTQSPLVAQSFVHGDSFRSYLVAIIVPDPEAVASWAKANGCGAASLAGLCRDPRLKAEVMEELHTIAERSKLQRFEEVRAVYLEPDPFSVQNGLLTPTLKLKRPQALAKYAEIIGDLYVSTAVVASPRAKL